MAKDISIEQIHQIINNDVLKSIFDIIRIIEGGGTNRVCECHTQSFEAKENRCFSFWNRGNKCTNCVSKQASIANQQMVKLEYFNDSYYFVIAKPFYDNEKQYILEMITNITTQLATGYENIQGDNFIHDIIRQLEVISTTDNFTGVLNKNHFISELDKTINETELNKNKFFLVIFDFNFFKTINDCFGHVKGDDALLNFATILKQNTQNTNHLVGRFGGDEFILLLKDLTLSDAEEFVKNILIIAEEFELKNGEFQMKFSTSHGLIDLVDIKTSADALAKADIKLYENKKLFHSKQ